MSEITQIKYNPAQIALIRRTVAKDCNEEEFNLFIEMCKHQGLDPFRKQVYAFVFKNKKRQKDNNGHWGEVVERKLTCVTSIDGYRAKAARGNDYRPDESRPEFEYDNELKDPDSNPLGIVSCTVKAYKFGPDKQWYPCVGTVYWDEYAPIVEDGKWVNGQFEGNGRMIIDKKKPNWRKMARTMIAKCAEAQALRKGWPEEMSRLYVEEEIEKSYLEMTATEAAEKHEQEERMRRTASKDTIPAILEQTEGLQLIPTGQFADKVLEYVGEFDSKQMLDFWQDQNRRALQSFGRKSRAMA